MFSKFKFCFRKNENIKQPTSHLDLGSTLIDLCGGPKLPETDGESLLELLKGETPENPNRVVVSQLADNKGDNPSAMIRKNEWKLVSHQGYPEPQVFNLHNDPEEVNDLADNLNFHAKKVELLEELCKTWDGDHVAQHLKRTCCHIELLKQWYDVIQPETFDQWLGSDENNFLIAETTE